MKLLFTGWKRVVKPHSHQVAAVRPRGDGFVPMPAGEPITWSGPFTARGRVSKLGLSGDFLVEFTFEEQELRNWLRQYIDADPAAAIRLLAESQAEAVIALSIRSPAPGD